MNVSELVDSYLRGEITAEELYKKLTSQDQEKDDAKEAQRLLLQASRISERTSASRNREASA